MINAKMFTISNINQTIIATPPIRVDDTLQTDLAPYNRWQRGFRAIRYDLGIDLTVALEKTKDNCLAERSAASFSSNPSGTKERFVNFNLTGKGRLCFTVLSNALSDRV